MPRTRSTAKLAILAAGIALALAGCTKYYKIVDKNSGEEHYAKGSSIKYRGGSIVFKDEATGSIVTLSQSAQVPITKEEYRANTGDQ